MVQTHIFYDGTLAVPLIGPLVEYIPNFWRDILYEVVLVLSVHLSVFATEIINTFESAFVIMTYTWILTPATTILQYTAFAKFQNDNVLKPNCLIHRDELSQCKRLLIAFTPTAFCLVLIAVSSHKNEVRRRRYQYTIPMTMPSPELAEIMQVSLKEFYELEPNEFLYCYGVSIKHARINAWSINSETLKTNIFQNGKSVVLFVIMFAALPYSISYVIIVTLMIMVNR